MRRIGAGVGSALLCAAALSLTAASAAAAPAPAWNIRSIAVPTNFVPGDTGHDYFYEDIVANKGGAVTDSSKPFVVTDMLPAGLTVRGVEFLIRSASTISGVADFAPTACATETINELATVKCTVTSSMGEAFEPTSLYPSEAFRMIVHVNVPVDAAGPLQNTAEISGGGAAAVSLVSHNPASSQPAGSGLEEFRAEPTDVDGEEPTQAGGHPFSFTTSFAVNSEHAPAGSSVEFVPAGGDLRNIEVRLPPGLVGNPQAAPPCTQQQFGEVHAVRGPVGNNLFQNSCPPASAVGLLIVDQLEGRNILAQYPIYNLVPPEGMPAQFGTQVVGAPIYIDTKVRTGGDYGITAYLVNTTQARPIGAASVTFWGVPADPVHDRVRGTCLDDQGFFSLGSCPGDNGTVRPFLQLSTACGTPLLTEMLFDTWISPAFAGGSSDLGPMEGCESLDFSPTLKARPTTDAIDSPSGLSVDLHLPAHEGCAEEAGGEIVCENAEALLEDARVTLPEGLVVNPAGANGLDACSATQVGYEAGTSGPAEFTPGPPECPDASRIGTVKVKTPLLDHPLPGSVYLARPFDNPFGSLLAIYIGVYDPASGVVVKLPGRVEADPDTGRLTTTFEENPQLPFEDFELEFFKGNMAPLMTPPTCGSYATTSSLASWAGQSASPSDRYAIDRNPAGGICPSDAAALPNAPSFSAGTVTPIAGAYSPFVLNLRREDGSQRFSVIETTLPEGLVGKLAGVPYCPQSAIDAAGAKGGREGLASPSCPSASQVGSVVVGAGAGATPYYVSGKAYLAGPYEGGPLSIVVITPAVAGPFDLGTVVTRVALHVDPATAQITARSDPLPSVLKAGGDGFPLDIRSIAMNIDRPSFTLNPTSCDPMSVGGTSLSTLGQAATLSDRFQVGECGRLGFKPKLSLTLKGETNRGAHPALRAVLTMPTPGIHKSRCRKHGKLRPCRVVVPRQANIAKAAVTLPHSEFLDQGHIKNVCTQVQFKGEGCPKDSVLGHARAISPLLDQPLEGPVYLMSGFGHQLPDLAADLNGQIRILLHGKVDTGPGGGIRNTFEVVPDAPVTKFVLSLEGGNKGLIQNSENVCARPLHALALFDAQNGKVADLRPALRDSKCGKQGNRRKPAKRRSAQEESN